MANIFKIETRGFAELQKEFRDAPRKIQDIGREWARGVAEDEAKQIRALAPARTGKFKSTIHPYSRAFVIGVQFDPYPKLGFNLLNWIIEGTKPHIIAARKAKALHFISIKRHGWVFAKRVWHPGTKPNDFVTRGAQVMDERIQRYLDVLSERIAELFK